jgi:hypothetical protein
MASDPASILEAIKRGGLDASLFTTFNATLSFYEDVLLRKLTAVGCRNNVVLMDRRQCAIAYASEATRPRLAGIAYTLVPIGIAGAFHSKLCVLAGKKRASVFVGSHNLTISGFGYNREVTNHVDMAGAPGTADRGLLTQAWMTAREWISTLGTNLPASLLSSAYALDSAFGTQIAVEQGDGPRLIAQRPGGDGLLEQLKRVVSGRVRRITICGAFFDHDNALLMALAKQWEDAEIVVGIEPSTVWMGLPPAHPRIRVVDVGNLGANKKKPGYLHAKAIYVEGDGRHLFASGSANPSGPAWMTQHAAPNVETMLVRFGKDADACARALGMHALCKKQPLNSGRLSDVVTRSRNVSMGIVACPALHVGIADHTANIVRVVMDALPTFDSVVVLDDLDRALLDPGMAGIASDGFRVPDRLMEVRTLQLVAGTTIVARVLVHHTAVIAQRVNGAARESATQLLRQLGSQLDDISRILPHLERVIFSQTISDAVRLPGSRAAVTSTGDGALARPDSLGISVSDMRRSVRPSLFSNSHDLAYVIDVLMQRIDVKDEPPEPGIDRVGRSEEEQIGQDDDTEEPLPAAPTADATDAEIAEAVAGKATKLSRRMAKALHHGGRTPDEVMVKVVQLVAVLALLRELAHLELADRWRKAHTNFLWPEDLELLFEAAAKTLLANGSEALNVLSDDDGLIPEEVALVRQLLIWLAWMTHLTWYTPGTRIDAEEIEERAVTNAQLLELLPQIASDSEQWSSVKHSVELTRRIDPIAVEGAGRWLSRHSAIGRQLKRLEDEIPSFDSKSRLPIRAGDVIQVPGVINYLAVAAAADERYVAVEVGTAKARQFQASRVQLVGRI